MRLGVLEEKQSVLLDLLRAVAALLVLVHHVKNGFFTSYASLDKQVASDIVVSIFYFLTGFGKLPVLFFFVLSGFFISRSILKSLQRNNWSWKRYIIDRFVRLEVVLIPALILTFFWDVSPQVINHFNSIRINPGNHLFCLIGNLFFLQTIFVQPYGSNFPLWSLSYEFWYYMLFPLLLIPAYTFIQTKQLKLLPLLLFVLFVAVLNFKNSLILKYSLIWLLGVLPNILPEPPKTIGIILGKCRIFLVGIISLTAMVIFRTNLDAFPRQVFAGFLFMVVIYIIINGTSVKASKRSKVDDFIKTTAGFSYTTYLAHAPVIAFLAKITAPRFGLQWQPTFTTMMTHLAITLVILLYSYLLASFTEAHTLSVRQFFYNAYLSSKKSLT